MVEINERGEPVLPVAGPRGRVFPYGYGRGDETPTCSACGAELVLSVADNVWSCVNEGVHTARWWEGIATWTGDAAGRASSSALAASPLQLSAVTSG